VLKFKRILRYQETFMRLKMRNLGLNLIYKEKIEKIEKKQKSLGREIAFQLKAFLSNWMYEFIYLSFILDVKFKDKHIFN